MKIYTLIENICIIKHVKLVKKKVFETLLFILEESILIVYMISLGNFNSYVYFAQYVGIRVINLLTAL